MTHPSVLSVEVPTETQHFRAYYTPWLGLTLLLLGGVTAGLSLWAMLQQGGFIALR